MDFFSREYLKSNGFFSRENFKWIVSPIIISDRKKGLTETNGYIKIRTLSTENQKVYVKEPKLPAKLETHYHTYDQKKTSFSEN